jgi:uncharacterized membrane protein YdbT with pleckstrin-like domain
MSSGTPPPTPPSANNGKSNGNAPTEPMHGSTASLGPAHQQRQQLAQASQGVRLPRWQGHPPGQQHVGYNPPGQKPAGPAGPAFPNQQPGENLIFKRRKHLIVLVLGGLPALLAGLGLVGLLVLRVHSSSARFDALLLILGLIVAVVFVVFTVKWLAVDLIGWLFNIYILTDRRLVDASGFITPRRQEAPLDRIQQVQVNRANVFEYLFDFGDVVIVTAGSQGNLTFDAVAHPQAVSDLIRETELRFMSGGKPAGAVVEPRHPAVKKVLDDLAKPVVVSAPPPSRPAGRPLRHRAEIRFLEGEQIIEYVRRHWFILVRREFFPALIISVSLGASGALAALFHTEVWLVPLVGVLVGGVFGLLVYLNYIDDVFILTTHRLIDIDRFLFIFFEGRKQTDYSRVQDVRVSVNTIIGRILDYGDITSETAGRLPNIQMTEIPHPFAIQDKILSMISTVKERDAVAAANRQRLEYRRLIASTMNALLVEVPDVRQLFMLDAAERLRQAGLKLVVESERRALGVPPGVVMSQIPSAGSTALSDSEVQVVLSGR